MNLQQFTLPATIAAVFHAALLMSGTHHPVETTAIAKIERVDLTPRPEPSSEPPTPTEEPVAEVKTLSGGPSRPELPDELREANGPFTVELIKTTKVVVPLTTTQLLPPGEGGNGPAVWTPGNSGFRPQRELDAVPRAKVQMPPEYPASLRHDKIDGVVTVEFDVDVQGRVVSARVKNSTHRDFEEPTLRAVRKWRFEPGVSQGVAVPFRMAVPVNFRLEAN